MRNYYPDKWVVVKMTKGEVVEYKVLGEWGGNFTSGSDWRLSSGIVKHSFFDESFVFRNHTGSYYHCNKHKYGLGITSSTALKGLEEQFECLGVEFDVLSYEEVVDKWPYL